MQDEIYVKIMLLYHGGTLFGRATDNSQSIAKSVLGVLISCMCGGLISTMLPIAKLNSPFLYVLAYNWCHQLVIGSSEIC